MRKRTHSSGIKGVEGVKMKQEIKWEEENLDEWGMYVGTEEE